MTTIPVTTFANMVENWPEIAPETNCHFSLGGEDIHAYLALRYEAVKGKFVDIGAYHPTRYSNTYLLYCAGWTGYNIDANAEILPEFHRLRPKDVSLQALVSDNVEEKTYYKFSEGAFNNCQTDVDIAEWNKSAPESKQIIGVEKLKTVPINWLLNETVGSNKFDFLSIDVEGLDRCLFLSIDFERFRPKLICIEWAEDEHTKDPVKSILNKYNYEHCAFLGHSSMYICRTP